MQRQDVDEKPITSPRGRGEMPCWPDLASTDWRLLSVVVLRVRKEFAISGCCGMQKEPQRDMVQGGSAKGRQVDGGDDRRSSTLNRALLKGKMVAEVWYRSERVEKVVQSWYLAEVPIRREMARGFSLEWPGEVAISLSISTYRLTQ